MAERQELVLENGVLAFDGAVVEGFGFTTGGSQRVPVSQLKAINLSKSRLDLNFHGSNLMPLIVPLRNDEAGSAELSGFLDSVRAGAPDLEDS